MTSRTVPVLIRAWRVARGPDVFEDGRTYGIEVGEVWLMHASFTRAFCGGLGIP